MRTILFGFNRYSHFSGYLLSRVLRVALWRVVAYYLKPNDATLTVLIESRNVGKWTKRLRAYNLPPTTVARYVIDARACGWLNCNALAGAKPQ